MNKTLVLTKTETKQSTIQIAFVFAKSWCVRGVNTSETGLFDFAKLPTLPSGTPIVDMTTIQNVDIAKGIIQRHSSVEGISNPDILAKLLQGLGAKVAYSVGGNTSK